MLSGYNITEEGVVHESAGISKMKYDHTYVNAYNNFKLQTEYMSWLRYGYMVASIGYTPKSVLDVGYGNGEFLKVCSKTIEKCMGNDVSEYPLPDKCEFVEIYEKTEVITFFDSLEHFEDISFVKNLNSKFLIISVPWCHHPDDDEWFSSWKHRKPGEHLWHFNHVSLVKFMKSNDYSLINYCNIEDAIRKSVTSLENILTASFVRA